MKTVEILIRTPSGNYPATYQHPSTQQSVREAKGDNPDAVVQRRRTRTKGKGVVKKIDYVIISAAIAHIPLWILSLLG